MIILNSTFGTLNYSLQSGLSPSKTSEKKSPLVRLNSLRHLGEPTNLKEDFLRWVRIEDRPGLTWLSILDQPVLMNDSPDTLFDQIVSMANQNQRMISILLKQREADTTKQEYQKANIWALKSMYQIIQEGIQTGELKGPHYKKFISWWESTEAELNNSKKGGFMKFIKSLFMQ